MENVAGAALPDHLKFGLSINQQRMGITWLLKPNLRFLNSPNTTACPLKERMGFHLISQTKKKQKSLKIKIHICTQIFNTKTVIFDLRQGRYPALPVYFQK